MKVILIFNYRSMNKETHFISSSSFFINIKSVLKISEEYSVYIIIAIYTKYVNYILKRVIKSCISVISG